MDDRNSSLQLQQTSKGVPAAGKSQNMTDSNNSEPRNDQGDQIHTVGFYDSNEIPFFDLEERDNRLKEQLLKSLDERMESLSAAIVQKVCSSINSSKEVSQSTVSMKRFTNCYHFCFLNIKGCKVQRASIPLWVLRCTS